MHPGEQVVVPPGLGGAARRGGGPLPAVQRRWAFARACSRVAAAWVSWVSACSRACRALRRCTIPLPRRSCSADHRCCRAVWTAAVAASTALGRAGSRVRRHHPIDGPRRRRSSRSSRRAVLVDGSDFGPGEVAARYRPVARRTSPEPPTGPGRAGCGCCGAALGELAALGDGGNVGPVAGQHPVRGPSAPRRHPALCVTTRRRLSAPATGSTDVETPTGGGRGDELDADAHGVGLVAVLGGHVAEPHMLTGVVGREDHGAVSPALGHGERTVGVDGLHGPSFTVADPAPRSWW